MKQCELCKKEYSKSKFCSKKNWEKSRFCSWNCRAKGVGKKRIFQRVIIQSGYRYLWMPEHPNASIANKSYVAEHRWIMENYLGRKLLKSERVHHLNGNKFDNRIENLSIMTQSEHVRLHRLGTKHTAETKKKMSISAYNRYGILN